MNDVELVEFDNTPIHLKYPARVLIPITPECDHESLLRLANWFSVEEPVLLLRSGA